MICGKCDDKTLIGTTNMAVKLFVCDKPKCPMYGFVCLETAICPLPDEKPAKKAKD